MPTKSELMFLFAFFGAFMAAATGAQAGDPCRSCPRPPSYGPTAPQPQRPAAPDGEELPPAESIEPAGEDYAAPAESVAAAPATFAPNMIGDLFGGGLQFDGGHHTTLPIAGGDRRFKIAENNSPLPRDRFLFNYHHFENALLGGDGSQTDLDRFTFGVEKTFGCEQRSIELRIPFAAGLDSDQVFAQTVEGTEFGNISLALKSLLWRDPCRAMSVGLGIVLPTADDARLFTTPGGALLGTVENDAVHLQPFIGYLATPSDRLFYQAFAQLDFDTNGNIVRRGNSSGRIHDQTLLMFDFQVGYWLYRNECCCRYLTGIAPVAELHYTTTIEDSDSVLGVSNPFNRQDILNITGGLQVSLGRLAMLTVAASAPLRDEEDALYDAELLVQFNRWF